MEICINVSIMPVATIDRFFDWLLGPMIENPTFWVIAWLLFLLVVPFLPKFIKGADVEAFGDKLTGFPFQGGNFATLKLLAVPITAAAVAIQLREKFRRRFS